MTLNMTVLTGHFQNEENEFRYLKNGLRCALSTKILY